MSSSPTIRLGVDIGGTFTDVALELGERRFTAHDNHTLFRASGPGEADYKQQLADYDAAFAAFFQRLQSHGIDKSNTLFVVTVDEGDHFAGGIGTPQADGSLAYSHTPCAPQTTTCPANQIG